MKLTRLCRTVVVLVLSLLLNFMVGASKVRLEFWIGHPSDVVFAQHLASIVEQFGTTSNGVDVNVSYMGGSGNYLDKLVVATASGAGPDAAHMWDYQLMPATINGMLLDLYRYVKPSELRKSADLTPGAMEQVLYEGGLYGLPIAVNTYGLIYNMDHFNEAGLPHEPRTIPELDHYAQKLTRLDGGDQIDRLGFAPRGFSSLYWGWVFGGSYWDDKAKQYTLSHPGIIDALEWVMDYNERFGLDRLRTFNSQMGSDSEGKGQLTSGRQSIFDIGQFRIGTLRRVRPDVNFGFAPLPTIPGGPLGATLLEGDFIAAFASTSHPREAVEFVTWLGSSKVLAQFLREGKAKNVVPLIPHVGVPEALYDDDYKMWFRLTQSANAHNRPFTPVYARFSPVLNDAVNKVQSGQAPARGALEEANRVLNVELANARLVEAQKR